MSNQSVKHTPGPWIIGKTKAGEDVGIFGPFSEVGILRSTNRSKEETQANAALIAAAPELLEALQTVEVWLIAPDTSKQVLESMYQLVKSVVAKAEGR